MIMPLCIIKWLQYRHITGFLMSAAEASLPRIESALLLQLEQVPYMTLFRFYVCSSQAISEIQELQDKLWLPSNPSNTQNYMLIQDTRFCVQFVMNMGVIWARTHTLYRPQQRKSMQLFFSEQASSVKQETRVPWSIPFPIYRLHLVFSAIVPTAVSPQHFASVIVTLSVTPEMLPLLLPSCSCSCQDSQNVASEGGRAATSLN